MIARHLQYTHSASAIFALARTQPRYERVCRQLPVAWWRQSVRRHGTAYPTVYVPDRSHDKEVWGCFLRAGFYALTKNHFRGDHDRVVEDAVRRGWAAYGPKIYLAHPGDVLADAVDRVGLACCVCGGINYTHTDLCGRCLSLWQRSGLPLAAYKMTRLLRRFDKYRAKHGKAA